MRPIRIAIIGFGKIAADQHVPSIAANPRLELVATSSRSGQGVATIYSDWRKLLDEVEGLEAVAITTPPSVRYEIARACIEAGLHVLLEKPPAVTLSEVDELSCLAEAKGVTLFATWHARHNPAVSAAAQALAGKRIAEMRIVWHEDVHKWHPGQTMDLGAGRLRRVRPGHQRLLDRDRHLPRRLVRPFGGALLSRECATPRSPPRSTSQATSRTGRCTAASTGAAPRARNGRSRSRRPTASRSELTDGGARLIIDGVDQQASGPGEYPDIYREFVDLIDQRRSSVDVRPLRLVADCFLASRRRVVEPVAM